MIVDTHAHLVSPELIGRVARDGDRLGIRCCTDPHGTALEFAGVSRSRPLFEAMTSVTMRSEAMARAGVDLQLVSPWVDLFGYALPPEQGEAWARTLNETLAASIAGQPHLAGMASVPLQDGRRAARELERAVSAHGFRGVEIGTNIAGVRSLDDPDLEPFWSACEATAVGIFIHPVDALKIDRIAPFYGWNLIGNPLETAFAATRLIFGGVLDRHPSLRILLCHGGGHFPYQIGRLDQGYALRPETKNTSAQPPSDYLRRFSYDSVLNAPEPLKFLLGLVGTDRVTVGTDLPFDMGDEHPSRTLDALGLSAADRARVESENALALFGLHDRATVPGI
jgi:aminocarboxymuconate-semialdehyde decarboxylase